VIAEKYKVGVIYHICEADNSGIVKIGYTYNLKKRLEQLQSAHYKELIVKSYYFTQFPQEEEKIQHSLNYSHRIRGEWFHVKN
jgi:hypothetical protein